MGQLAFLRAFILVAIPLDANDNRRHVHVFKKGKRHLRSAAKIWIESNGEQCVEIAQSTLSASENKLMLLTSIGLSSMNKFQKHFEARKPSQRT